MRALAIIVAVLVGLILGGALAWNAAEAHYQGCVQAAQLLPSEHAPALGPRQARYDEAHDQRAGKRVQGCSRWP